MPRGNHRLWTPVSNAFEAYRRRLLVSPAAVYEHIWRLIHIEEALVVTLGSALASRLMAAWEDVPDKHDLLNRLRELLTGLSDNADAEVEDAPSEGACWQGFIGAWTDLLNHFGAKETIPNCPFCSSLKQYLEEERKDEPLAFIEPWQRIGPVAETFKTTRSRIGRIKAINSLRNKLAHVPVSERILQDLHSGIRKEVLSLITPDDGVLTSNPQSDPRTTRWHETLLGRICSGKAFVTGTDFGQDGEKNGDGVCFEWASGPGDPFRWDCSPFIRLDEELKVLILFRLDGLEADLDENEKFLRGEYHRFAAEIEPVQVLEVQVATILPWIPKRKPEPEPPPTAQPAPTLPAETQQPAAPHPAQHAPIPVPAPPPEDLSAVPPGALRSRAESAYRNRDYPLANRLLNELAERPAADHLYNHVTKLRHGEVLWKTSERGSEKDNERVDGIRRAIELLKEATDHRDVRYAAKARYQLSKAFWHLWRYTHQQEDLDHAVNEAQQAANLVFESQYISWYERLRQETAPHEVGTVSGELRAPAVTTDP